MVAVGVGVGGHGSIVADTAERPGRNSVGDGMDSLEAWARADDEFDRRVRLVGPDDWVRPTPCAGWTVRDLVAHVVAGNRISVIRLRGGTDDEVAGLAGSDVLGDDAVGAYEWSAAASRAAFARPGALERTVTIGSLGEIAAPRFLELRTADLGIHAWDLARAIGVDEWLDPELADAVLESFLPMAGSIGAIGVYGTGPSGGVTDDAPAQTRLLDLTGRRP